MATPLRRTTPEGTASTPDTTDAFRALTAQILGRVVTSGPRTITELSEGLPASRPTIRRALDGLESSSLVRSAGLRASDTGRPAVQYERGPGSAGLIGIDARPFSTHIAGVTTSGHVHGRRDLHHDHVDDATRLPHAFRAVETLLTDAGADAEPRNIVLGVPGIVGPGGLIQLSRIIPSWTGLALGDLVSQRFPHAHVRVENDMSLRALAEMHSGSASGLTDFVYLTDNGHLRPAVVMDGRLRRGAHHALGEDNSLFHVGLVPRTLHHEGRAVGFRDIAPGLEDGTLDTSWLPVLQEALVDLLLTIRYLLDPQAFIIDGPTATTSPDALEELHARLAARTSIGEVPRILPAHRTSDVTLHGALTLALRDALTTMLQVAEPPVPSLLDDSRSHLGS